MVFIIDGVLYHQDGADPLAGLQPEQIYSIEVLTSGANLNIYGDDAYGGAIVITTKRGVLTPNLNNSFKDGTVDYVFNGFHKARTFYSPKYEAEGSTSHTDARTTIYWQPELETDEKGNASFSFYNADTPGNYRVVIEGMDEQGDIGRRVFHYSVQ